MILYRLRIVWCCMIMCTIGSYTPTNAIGWERGKKPKHLKSEAYIQWVESQQNGLNAKASAGMLDFFVQYRPLNYIVLKEARSDKDKLTKKELNTRKKEIEGMEYYTFVIALNDGRKDLIKTLSKSTGDYEQTLLYFANDIQQDLKLVAGKDTLDCKLFHLERTYGITTYAKFVLGFENYSNKDKNGDRTLLFLAKILGANLVSIRLKEEDVHNIPKLVFRD